MMNEERSVLKIMEDVKLASYASAIAVVFVTSVIRIMGSGTSLP